MQPELDFRLRPDNDANELRSALLNADGSVIAQVRGRVLEAAYRLQSGYLVLTSDGNPYEEVLHCHLFSAAMDAVDDLSLGQAYASGIVKHLRVVEGQCLEFSFFGDEIWRLSIAGEPQMQWKPQLFDSVQYPQGWLRKHQLRLERIQD